MNTSTEKSNQLIAWGLLLFLSFVWGSSFILIKKALIAFTPLQVGAGRTVFAFLAFLPLFIFQFKKIDWSKFWPLLTVGLCGSGLPAFLYAIAQSEVPSALAGMLNGLTPIFAFVLAIIFFGRKFAWKHMAGVLLGLLGTALIFISKTGDVGNFNIYYGLFIVVATLLYGISANTVSKFLGDINPVILSTVSFVLIGPWVLVYLLNTDFITVVQTHDYGYKSLMALLTLSLIGTFAANILFFKLIQMTDPVFSSSVSFIVPIVALAWGIFDGEIIHPKYFLAFILIILGVFFIKRKP